MRRLLIVAGAACLLASPALASVGMLGSHQAPTLATFVNESIVLAANDDKNKDKDKDKNKDCDDKVSQSKSCKGNNGFGNGGGDGSPNGKPDGNR